MKKIKIIIFLTFFFFSLFNLTSLISANNVDQLKKQIQETNSQIIELDRQIAQYQQQIAQTTQEKNTLDKLIKELTLTRNKLVAEKTQTQKKIDATDLVIQELSSDINEKEKSIQNFKKSLSQMISDIYIRDNQSVTLKILSQKTLAEASQEYNNILSLNDEIRGQLKEIRSEKEALLSSKNQKENEQEKLESLKKELILKQQAVENTKKEKDQVLIQTKNKETEYQKILAEQIKRKDAFLKAIEDYEAQIKFILNPDILPKPGSEVLAWPLSSILITSPFGPRWGGFHYGLDFRASVGTPVFAMASGTVEGTGDTDIDCKGASFGKWIFIRHNNGLASTYAHLSAISVKKGDTVKVGQTIGLSGNTGYSTGPHLHVNVYASTGVNVETVPSKSCNGKIFTQPISAKDAYLDPLLYLPKTTKNMFRN